MEKSSDSYEEERVGGGGGGFADKSAELFV